MATLCALRGAGAVACGAGGAGRGVETLIPGSSIGGETGSCAQAAVENIVTRAMMRAGSDNERMAPLQQLERASLRAYLWVQTSPPLACAAAGGTLIPLALMLSPPWQTRPARPLARTRAVATTGVRSTARPAQMMGDWCRQVSWLTAHAHRLRLPVGCPAVALGATLAAYSCGGSRGFEDVTPRTAFPFHPPQPEREPRQDRHAPASKQSGS